MSKIRSQAFEFSTLSKWLHWGAMFLLIGLMITGTTMAGLEDSNPQKMMLYRVHPIIGILIILTTLARIVFRLRSPQPMPEGMTEKWNIWLHGIIQWSIYVVLLGIGASGLGNLALNNMTIFTADPAALDRTVPTIQGHFLFTRLFLALVSLHITGVIRHQFTRSNVLRRMGLNIPLSKG